MTSPLLRYVDAADGTRIAWQTHLAGGDEDAAGARPLVVLTNGLSTTENFWDGLIPPLASAYRVVHWNYRGHSKSESARSGDYAIATHADDLARVTEAAIARGTDRSTPVHVAFSMGVTVLLELYRRRPDLVGGMVLVAGGADQPRASSALFRVPLARQTLRYESNMVFLASIVSGAPFLGLLGTVWGVMDAFSAVSVQQTASIQTLAPGVSAALLTTISGLLVAIPCLFGYNMLFAMTKRLITELENFASSLADRIELESK